MVADSIIFRASYYDAMYYTEVASYAKMKVECAVRKPPCIIIAIIC